MRHLQTVKEPDFVSFVVKAGILGMYPSGDEHCVRAKTETYIEMARDGPAAAVRYIEPLSSREIFGLLCEFLYHCGNKHPVLKRLSSVPQAQDAAHFCNHLVRPKIHSLPVIRTRKKAAPPDVRCVGKSTTLARNSRHSRPKALCPHFRRCGRMLSLIGR